MAADEDVEIVLQGRILLFVEELMDGPFYQLRPCADTQGLPAAETSRLSLRVRTVGREYQLRIRLPIDPAAIRQIGVMIADKREGPFRIEIDSIKAWIDAGRGPASVTPERRAPGETAPRQAQRNIREQTAKTLRDNV